MPFKSVDSIKTQSLKPILLPWINYFFANLDFGRKFGRRNPGHDPVDFSGGIDPKWNTHNFKKIN